VNFADLHLHTLFSDGTYTPKKLVQEAKRVGLSVIAIADHDTIDAIDLAQEAAKDNEIEVLPALELTAEHLNQEIHILGYLIDHNQKQLIRKLSTLRENRVKRIYKIAEKLNGIGINLNAQSVFDISGYGTVGRLHVAKAMVKEKLVGSIYEAFQKYIGDKSPGYVLGFRLSAKEAITLIKNAGGIPVLAHPYSLNNDGLIPEFVDCGLMGLEVYYPEHSPSMTKKYLDFTKKYNLLATGGSDCHGSAKPQVKIGSIKIPYCLVERLKEAKNSRKPLDCARDCSTRGGELVEPS